MGEVAFELKLPPGAQIHLVFHVSKLKPFHNQNETPKLELPPTTFNKQPKLQSLVVLDLQTSTDSDTAEAVVQWQGLYPEDVTWENLDTLLNDYPTLHLEDKVFVEEERDDMAQEEVVEDYDHKESTNEQPNSEAQAQTT